MFENGLGIRPVGEPRTHPVDLRLADASFDDGYDTIEDGAVFGLRHVAPGDAFTAAFTIGLS
jgi:hypothetical protein